MQNAKAVVVGQVAGAEAHHQFHHWSATLPPLCRRHCIAAQLQPLELKHFSKYRSVHSSILHTQFKSLGLFEKNTNKTTVSKDAKWGCKLKKKRIASCKFSDVQLLAHQDPLHKQIVHLNGDPWIMLFTLSFPEQSTTHNQKKMVEDSSLVKKNRSGLCTSGQL